MTDGMAGMALGGLANGQAEKGRGKWAFLLALAGACLMFLPYIILDRGYFIYYGDFNVQQIPFYQMAHNAVRSGDIFWNWNTDLGANFIGSYSFYLLGSPFFWLTLPFPNQAVPYLLAPLLALKIAFASLFAYLYIKRFTGANAALLGALLYAFSGYSIYNVFFNHFHEAMVYFPLMLLGMERLMQEGKKGLFALSVFLSALCNYYFFIGQAIFLILYWVVRAVSGSWQRPWPRFFLLLFEAIVGTAMAAVILLPSYFAIIQNNRVEQLLAGWDFLVYDRPQRLLDIIHSFFFPQDIPARPNFFPNAENRWASMSAWLPVFSCSGVIAFLQSRSHKHWLRRMLIVCLFCALIPGLNAMFHLFNWMYYARWYYMMVLMLALATVMNFADKDGPLPGDQPINWKRAFGWCGGVTLAFALLIGFLPKSWQPSGQTGKITLGLYENAQRFWVFVAIALICLLLAGLLVLLYRYEPRRFFPWAVSVVWVVSLIINLYMIGLGKANSNYTPAYVIDYGIEQRPFDLPATPGSDTVRVDVNNGMDNQAMFWGLPTIQAFHSVVPGSIMEFYATVGITRSVKSNPDNAHYALRSLLSVRWLFEFANEKGTEYWDNSKTFERFGQTRMPGWRYFGTQNGFRIYENQNFIPMGFTYDYYIIRSQYEQVYKTQRQFMLLKALVVEDEDQAAVAQVLEPLPAEALDSLTALSAYSNEDFARDCQARNAQTVSTFQRDNRGFSATISLDRDNLVFFSVPYEAGWSATVNGQPATIYKANVGFMAVRVPAGQQVSIRFDYMTPGLMDGLYITIGAAGLWLLYLMVCWLVERLNRRRPKFALADDTQPLPSIFEEELPFWAGPGPEKLSDPPLDDIQLGEFKFDIQKVDNQPPELRSLEDLSLQGSAVSRTAEPESPEQLEQEWQWLLQQLNKDSEKPAETPSSQPGDEPAPWELEQGDAPSGEDGAS